jgi:hypothetical protein
MTTLRGSRSASTPPNKITRVSARTRAAMTTPTAVPEWVSSSTAKARAGAVMFSPSSDAEFPMKKSRNFRTRNTWNLLL